MRLVPVPSANTRAAASRTPAAAADWPSAPPMFSTVRAIALSFTFIWPPTCNRPPFASVMMAVRSIPPLLPPMPRLPAIEVERAGAGNSELRRARNLRHRRGQRADGSAVENRQRSTVEGKVGAVDPARARPGYRHRLRDCRRRDATDTSADAADGAAVRHVDDGRHTRTGRWRRPGNRPCPAATRGRRHSRSPIVPQRRCRAAKDCWPSLDAAAVLDADRRDASAIRARA